MTPCAGLIPAELAEHTVERLCADHGARRPWIYWLVLGGAVSALAALPLVEVDLTVRAPGLVRPAMERTELKTAIGGRVGRVCARDNERVAAGQPLLELATRDLDERLARNSALQREQSDIVVDLQKLTTARMEEIGTETELGPAASLQSRWSFATAVLAREYAQYSVQVEAGRLAVAQARLVRDRVVRLAAMGIVTEQERDNASFAFDRAQSDLLLLARQTLVGWQARLRDGTTSLDALASEDKRLQEERTLATIRAPVTGTVQGLVGIAEGTYVLAGQSLGYISPDDRLVAEAYVQPRDIGLVRAGQPARLQIDAYPYTQWGLLDGVVESVAVDSGVGFNSVAPYKITIRPAATVLRLRDGIRGELRKGMTLSARLVVTRRSLLHLLYEDLSGWLDPEGVGEPGS
jgi:HlyD family secretion protein